MSSDTIVKDEDGERYSFDNLSTQKWLEGHKSGLEMGVEFLKEKAVELFKSGKHEAAIAMQKLANEMLEKLRPDMEKRAREHERDYPFRLGKE